MSTYRWLNDKSLTFLERDYLLPGQTLDERVDIICNHAEKLLGKPGFAARFKENIQKGWYSLSTPIWANFGTSRGLPISCFGSHIEDTMVSILSTFAEVGMMSKYGGGTSVYLGELRPRGSKITDNGTSSGSVHFAGLFDYEMGSISQGSTRRGNSAAYLPLHHKDINEFLSIRSEGHPIQLLSFGVSVTDEWLSEMRAGDRDKRTIWAKVIQSRCNTGYPYIIFTGNASKGAPDCYRDRKTVIDRSNLCTEIMLPSTADESFVCDLSSMNILYYDEWKDTDAVEMMTFFLDVVMTEFIQKAKVIPFMDRAVRFAERHRAIGIGWLGYHSYLQSRMIPFESLQAKMLNSEIARVIQRDAYAASAKLAAEFGECEMTRGYGRRNTTLCAIAPTKSSAFILGQVSEGIEPHRTNYYIKDLQKGKFTIKNNELMVLLETKGKNSPKVWDNILQNAGSVQHLDFLDYDEKAVFKTFSEISPMEIIVQAAQRQKFIDQGQSTNLIIDPKVPAKEVNALMMQAWELGIKSLYYQFSVNAAQQLSRSILSCSSCEG